MYHIPKPDYELFLTSFEVVELSLAVNVSFLYRCSIYLIMALWFVPDSVKLVNFLLRGDCKS